MSGLNPGRPRTSERLPLNSCSDPRAMLKGFRSNWDRLGAAQVPGRLDSSRGFLCGRVARLSSKPVAGRRALSSTPCSALESARQMPHWGPLFT